MTNDLALLDAANPLLRPFQATNTRLGVITKIYERRYISNCTSIIELFQEISEICRSMNPRNFAFSYLISFSDNTHIDGNNPQDFESQRLKTAKTVDRLLLKWAIVNNYDSQENEISIMVRISNPVNPIMLLQAALSKKADDFDNIEFSNGCTSASICGASPIHGDEFIQIVGRWIDARPRPEYVTTIHEVINKRINIIEWTNYWLMPLLGVIVAAIWMMKNPDSKYIIHVGVFGVLVHWYLCKISKAINSKIQYYIYSIQRYSVFDITNGDFNQMTKYAAKSKNSMYKLIASGVYGVLGNILAAYLCYYFLGFK